MYLGWLWYLLEDFLDLKIIETADGDCFYDFVQRYVIPHLIPFNGHNPHCVIIMDNCAIHQIATMIEDVGSLVYYLLPYSPDFSPIESAFLKVKLEMERPNSTYTVVLLLQAWNWVFSAYKPNSWLLFAFIISNIEIKLFWHLVTKFINKFHLYCSHWIKFITKPMKMTANDFTFLHRVDDFNFIQKL